MRFFMSSFVIAFESPFVVALEKDFKLLVVILILSCSNFPLRSLQETEASTKASEMKGDPLIGPRRPRNVPQKLIEMWNFPADGGV